MAQSQLESTSFEMTRPLLPFSGMIEIDELDPSIKPIVASENTAPVNVTEDRTLRLKILDKCGFTCVFCHNEGTPVESAYSGDISSPREDYRGGRVSVFQKTNGVGFLPGVMRPDDSFIEALKVTSDALGSEEVHFTGGEPTLHPDLAKMVELCTSLGFEVKITSNGENGARVLKDCKSAGLKKVNFSIFGINATELANVQAGRYKNVGLASRKIEALDKSIDVALENGIDVGVNVVMRDSSDQQRMEHVIEKYGRGGVSIRLLNDLSGGFDSYEAIYKLLSSVGASLESICIEAGSSSVCLQYRLPDGRKLGFKQIRKTTIEECESCPSNNAEDCKEGYYGTRLYVNNKGEYLAGVCIQRMDLVCGVTEFAGGSLSKQVVRLREQEKTSMNAYYGGRIISTGE